MSHAYRCSICDEVVEIGDMSKHSEAHQREPNWSGHMSWTRVDREQQQPEEGPR